MILKIFISQLSATFPYNLQLISFLKFFGQFRVNRSLRANEYFEISCTHNTEPLSETKFGYERIFEIGIFKGRKFCLRFKSFKSFSNEYVFV